MEHALCGDYGAYGGDGGGYDDDALLREALAFIGDVDLDDDGDAPVTWLGGPAFALPCEAGAASELRTYESPPEAATPMGWSQDQNLLPTSETNVVPPPPAPVPVARPPRTHSYSKRRGELLYLKDLVHELELRLGTLRKRVDDQPTESEDSVPPTSGTAVPSSQVLAAWEQVATRQYEQRHRAEMENVKLKRLLEDQIQVGKALERVLSRKRPKGIEGLQLPSEKRHQALPRLSVCSDATQIFGDLVASIDRQFVETARMFVKAQHVCPSVNHIDDRLVHDAELGLVLQTTECKIFPFSYDDTVQELWDSIPNIKVHGPHHIDKTDELQKIQVQIDVSLGPGRSAMQVYIASRRYVEAGRTVLISCAVVDPSHIADMDMDGIHMRHKGWCVIEPVLGVDGTRRNATRMRTYSLAVPETRGTAVQDHTHKAGALTNFVMSALSLDRETRHQTLENRLFERTRKLT